MVNTRGDICKRSVPSMLTHSIIASTSSWGKEGMLDQARLKCELRVCLTVAESEALKKCKSSFYYFQWKEKLTAVPIE